MAHRSLYANSSVLLGGKRTASWICFCTVDYFDCGSFVLPIDAFHHMACSVTELCYRAAHNKVEHLSTVINIIYGINWIGTWSVLLH